MEEMETDNDPLLQSQIAKIDDFANLTKCTEAYSQTFLKDHNWDIEEAVASYFEDYSNKSSVKVLSWNIDGLDKKHLDVRTMSVIKYIFQVNPEIVFLQELVDKSEHDLRQSLSAHYDFFVEQECGSYYCGILIRKHILIKINSELIEFKFDNSEMGRKLLCLSVAVKGVNLKLMTSHLESCQASSGVRKAQLGKAFDIMQLEECSTIFAGDMNIRDKEIREIGGVPDGIVDVACLFPINGRFEPTWEPKMNLNIPDELANAPGMRFDRMYARVVDNSVEITGYMLIGKDNIPDYLCHTSDHWAILGDFAL